MADTKALLKEANRRLYNINQRIAKLEMGPRGTLTSNPEYDSLTKARVELESHIRALQGARNTERAEAVGRAIMGGVKAAARAVLPTGMGTEGQAFAAAYAPPNAPPGGPQAPAGTPSPAPNSPSPGAFADPFLGALGQFEGAPAGGVPEGFYGGGSQGPMGGAGASFGAAPSLPPGIRLQRSPSTPVAPAGAPAVEPLGELQFSTPSPTQPAPGPMDNTLDALTARLTAMLDAAPPTLEESEPLPPGAAFAAATMAALDPARYATSVAPELKRRDADRVMRFNAFSQARQDEIQLLSNLLAAHERRLNAKFQQDMMLDRQEARLANQRAMQAALRFEASRANSITEQVNAAVVALNAVPSEQNRQRAEMLTSRSRSIHEALKGLALNADANPVLVNAIRMELDQTARQASGFLNLAVRDRATADLRNKAVMLHSVHSSMKRAVAFLKARGDVGGPIGGRTPWWLTPNYLEQDIEQLRAMFGYITGPLNRALGGGAALTPFEGEVLRGILLRVEDPFSKKMAGLEEAIWQVENLLRNIEQQGGGMVMRGEDEAIEREGVAPGSIPVYSNTSGDNIYYDPAANEHFVMEWTP